VGFAPTQGHIPSGVPMLGHLREELLRGGIRRAMVIGKGSLFLGRMTDLFDGTSLLLEANPGRGRATGGKEVEARAGAKDEERAARTAIEKAEGDRGAAASGQRSRKGLRVGLTVPGSELGEAELLQGARMALSWLPDLEILLIGGRRPAEFLGRHYPLDDEQDARRVMEELLDSGEIDAAVTMHYSFPIGLATVGRVITPGRGREMFIATTTGTTHQERIKSMLLNAVGGIGVARACGLKKPSLGIVNVEGAAVAKRELMALADRGYRINWGRSRRADGGELLRGNDLLSGEVDLAVVDSLTGNLLMKFFSAYTTGGGYEGLGYGYGPAVGPALGKSHQRLILIVSRASGAPVVAGAIRYGAELLQGGVRERVAEEYAAAGLAEDLDRKAPDGEPGLAGRRAVTLRTQPGLTAEIPGIDVLELEVAREQLERAGICAGTGMGCTGPVLLVSPNDLEMARKVLKERGYINA
ncbi:MAG: glycine/sarcosine/betaine reductase complex component C subunit alpha, partial [Syntrophomonadaceae bacterium]|nr:glycine/sarcosine/betaine reductase complex component C subunit alpha [Syntrophomonadaceae bacterium]